MEIIKINCEKVKISLSLEDMNHLHINCDMLDSIDDQGKQAFNKILDEAKLKCGFSTNGKRIFVQLFPSKDGGCEMFITRLNNEHEKRYTIGRRKKTNCYIFNEFNNLLSFCNAAKKNNYCGSSCLYIDENRKHYYLCLDRDFPLVYEFYGKKCIADTDIYLKEHYRLITANAIEVLGNLT